MVEGLEKGSADHEQVPARPPRVFASRGGRKLVRGIVFHSATGRRPNTLRIVFSPTKGTSLTLKTVDFRVQYRRAVGLVADHLGIATTDRVRTEMEDTADDFLAHYGLVTRKVRTGNATGEIEIVQDPRQPDFDASAARNNGVRDRAGSSRHAIMRVDGTVRGVTYRSRKGTHPAHIHVRPSRGKTASFSLENTSFSAQYAKAIAHICEAMGLPSDDPIRARMDSSGEAFLNHYKLVTGPLCIPDAVLNL